MRLISMAVVAIVLGALSRPAEAQAYWNPSAGSFPLSTQAAWYGWQAHQRKEAQAILDRIEGKSSGAPAKPRVEAPAVRHQPANASDFKPGPTRPSVDAYLASQRFPRAQEKLMRDLFDLMFTQVETHLRKHNVATAVGFVLVTAISISRGVEVGDDEVMETIANLNDALAGDAGFKKMTHAERQAVYDSMIMTGALLIYLQTAGKQDPRVEAQAREVASAIVEQLSGVAKPR